MCAQCLGEVWAATAMARRVAGGVCRCGRDLHAGHMCVRAGEDAGLRAPGGAVCVEATAGPRECWGAVFTPLG